MMRDQFTNLITKRLAWIDEILDANMDLPSLTYPEVFDVRDSTHAFENVLEMTGLGLFGEKSEGDTVSYDKILEGFHKKFTHKTYAKAMNISMEAADDDIDGAIKDVMPPLGMSARSSISVFAWNIINNGFGTTTTGDGVALFGNHTLRGGGNYSNLMGTSDLSVSTLETALNKFDDMVDERGLPVEISASKIVFPTNLRWIVHEILKSELRSDTANNATNAFSQVNLSPVMSKYLSGDDDWFLCAQPRGRGLILYWRKEPYSDHTIDFDTGNLKTKMVFRVSAGAATWREWVGAQGA